MHSHREFIIFTTLCDSVSPCEISYLTQRHGGTEVLWKQTKSRESLLTLR